MSAASAELQLCIQCCRAVFDRGNRNAIRDLSAAVDWDRVIRSARYHRIQGLVWNGLSNTEIDVPAQAAQALSADSEAIAAANLQIAGEASQLNSAFRSAGINLLFVKGLTLGALAYPNPFLKMGWDMDLLIDPRQLAPAAMLLRERGFVQTVPSMPASIQRWHGRRKESTWQRHGKQFVELHTRLADNRHLIPGIDVHSSRQEVDIAPGITLPTLGRDELFAYLCIHGASSAWFRLKWITDLAALLHDAPDIERLYERSQQLSAFRAAGQALLLADRLYGTLRGSPLRDRLQGDRATRRLAEAAFRQIAGRAEPREPTSTPFGTWRIHATQLSLKPGIGFKLGEIGRQIADAVTGRLAG